MDFYFLALKEEVPVDCAALERRDYYEDLLLKRGEAGGKGEEVIAYEESAANDVAEEGRNHRFPDIVGDCEWLGCLCEWGG